MPLVGSPEPGRPPSSASQPTPHTSLVGDPLPARVDLSVGGVGVVEGYITSLLRVRQIVKNISSRWKDVQIRFSLKGMLKPRERSNCTAYVENLKNPGEIQPPSGDRLLVILRTKGTRN